MSLCPYVPMSPCHPGKIFPGFKIPCGSNAALTRFESAMTSGDSSRPMYGAFEKPMPCSPLIEPFERDDTLEQLADGLLRARDLVGILRRRP